jgi:hypothetical protein
MGLVDQLVESALGNSDGLDLVARASHVFPRGNGELWVAPARGIALGVMRQRKDGRIDLPDVYRIAFSIGRKGGVSKVKA